VPGEQPAGDVVPIAVRDQLAGPGRVGRGLRRGAHRVGHLRAAVDDGHRRPPSVHAGHPGSHHRQAGGQVLEQLERLHAVGERVPPVREQPDRGGGEQSGDLLVRHRAQPGPRSGVEPGGELRSGRTGEHDRQLRAEPAGGGLQHPQIDPGLDRSDVDRERAVRQPGGGRAGVGERAAVDPVADVGDGQAEVGPQPRDQLSRVRGHRIEAGGPPVTVADPAGQVGHPVVAAPVVFGVEAAPVDVEMGQHRHPQRARRDGDPPTRRRAERRGDGSADPRPADPIDRPGPVATRDGGVEHPEPGGVPTQLPDQREPRVEHRPAPEVREVDDGDPLGEAERKQAGGDEPPAQCGRLQLRPDRPVQDDDIEPVVHPATVACRRAGHRPSMALALHPAHLRRYRQIAGLLLRHARPGLVRAQGLDQILDETDAPGQQADAEALANELEAMGPTFVKLGQLLASRVDLLPGTYIDALARLQDDVAPFGFAEVEEIIETELAVRLSRVFEDFDPQPLAAASLGQVHRATLRGNRLVAVKVQRPGIRRQVVEDLEAVEQIATFLDEHTDRGRRYALAELVTHFRVAMLGELDYRREAANLASIGEILAEHPRLVVPRSYDDLSTGRVLTMDYIDGRKVTDISPLGRLDLDGAGLADALFRGYLTQVLAAGVFHADPHPGNVLVTTDGRLALIDLGQVARIAPGLRERLVKMFVGLADGRSDEVARMLAQLGTELDDYDEAAFGRAVADIVARVAVSGGPSLPAGTAVLELARASAEAGLRPAPELSMLGKVLLNLDQVAVTLDPDFAPEVALRKHTAEILTQGMKTTPSRLLGGLLETREFAEALPGRVNRAMDALGSGHFELRVQAFDEVEFLKGLHKLANVAAAGLVLAAIILGTAVLARTTGGRTSSIALGVFIGAALCGLALIARVVLSSRNVRPSRRR